uniref:Uncharacterized protein n=1 Tax=Rhinolophus ferrumequinum TaxID=59479 RepID=A0A671DNI9_RHIFE
AVTADNDEKLYPLTVLDTRVQNQDVSRAALTLGALGNNLFHTSPPTSGSLIQIIYHVSPKIRPGLILIFAPKDALWLLFRGCHPEKSC